MIFPFSILSCLTLFVFWLPPDSGEKITLTITILLALTVFLQLISEYTPKASSNLPIIGKYPGASILCRILSDLIGSDDPTKSYRIPGDGFTPDSVRQIYQMFQILRAVVLAILEKTLFDASDLTIGSDPTDSDIIPSPGIL
jgi:hypothetical protein